MNGVTAFEMYLYCQTIAGLLKPFTMPSCERYYHEDGKWCHLWQVDILYYCGVTFSHRPDEVISVCRQQKLVCELNCNYTLYQQLCSHINMDTKKGMYTIIVSYEYQHHSTDLCNIIVLSDIIKS